MKTNIKSRNQIIVIVVTLLIGLFLGWLIFREKDEDQIEEALAESELAEEITWTCSMHPQVRQPEPGDCPICGMDLIPLEEDDHEHAEAVSVSMSPTAMQLANIRTAKAGKMEPVKSLRLTGKVQPDERLVFSQSSHIPGRIEDLNVDFTGEYVRKGQTLAKIYSPDLVTAQEELFEAQRMKEQQPELFRAAKEKLKNWKLSDEQINDILTTGEARENFAITADVSGYVTEKFVNLGDYIDRGEAIYEIAGLSRVWVLFDVYESDMPWIDRGDEISFTVASLPGEEFGSTITYIDPVIDPETRVAKARVEVSNSNLQLKPEMFASGIVQARLPESTDAPVIPKSAVMWTGERSIVYVKTTTDQVISFKMAEVILGPALGDSYIVKSGLSGDEEIAVHGTFSIDAAAQLAGKPSMMNPKGGEVMTAHSHGDHMVRDTEMADMEMEEEVSEDYEAPAKFKQQLTSVYHDYLVMKNHFVETAPERVSKAAEDVLKSLKDIDMGLLDENAHDLYMQHSGELKNTIAAIAESKDIDRQRKEFSIFNRHFAEVIKTFGLDGESTYYQYCPMANQDEGAYWFSEISEIRNPYFGDEMLMCGETRDTIK